MEIPEPGEVFHGDDGTTSVVLAESHDPNYEPTQEELEEYAAYIGLDLAKEPQLKWIAMEGLRAALPPEWRACKTGDGEIYYFNFANGESLWEHPLDEKFKQKVIAERAKLNTAAASSSRSSPPSSARATATANATKSESAKASNTTTSTSSSRRTNTTVGATKAISAALLGFASEDTHKAAEPSAAQLLLRPGLNSNSKSTTSSGNALTHLVPPRLETLPTASSLTGRPALPDVLTEGGAHHGSPLLETVMHNNNNNINRKNNNVTTAMSTVASSVKSGNSPAPFGALSMGSPSITPTSATTATTTSVGFGMGSPNGPPSAAAASGPMMMMGSRDIEATIRKRVEDEYAPRRRAVRLQLDKELIAERAQLAQKLSALREELQQARQRDKAQATAKAAGANNNNSNTTTTSDSNDAQQEEEQVWARRLQSAQTQRDALQSKVREREAAVQEVRGRSLLQLERELAARTDKEVDAQRRALQAETDAEVKRIDEEEAAKLQKLQAELARELSEVQAAEEAATRRADELNASQSEKMLKMLREALRSQQDKLAEAKKTKQQQQQQQQTEKDEQRKTGDDDALSEKDEAVVRQVERACAEALASLEADYAQQQASLEAKIAEAKKAAHQETTTNTTDTASAAAADETVDYGAKLKAEEAALSAELQRRRTAYEQETNALVAKAASEAAQQAASSTPSTQAPQEATKRGQETPRAVQDAEKTCAQSSQVHAIRTRHVAAVKQLELIHEKTMRELRQGHTRRLAELGTFDPRKTPEYSARLTERKRAWLAAHPAPTFTLPTGGGTKAAQPSGPSSAMQATPSSAGEEMDEVTVEESVVRKAVEEKLAEVRAEMHEAQARALDELAMRKTAELASFGERYRAEQLKKARSELEQEQRMHAASKNEALEKEDEDSAQEEEEEEEDSVTEEALTTLRTSVAALKQRVAQASKEETTGKETSAVQDEDEEGVSAEQATREQNALRTRWQAILQALQAAIAQEMERNAQLRRALADGAATSTTAMSAQADSAPLPLAASYLAPMGGSSTSGEAANLSLSHDRPPTAPSAASTAAAASWANNMRASTPPVSWSTPAAVNNNNNNNNNTMSGAAGGQTPNTPIHASQRIASHTVGELYARAGPGTHRQHNHPYAITTINNYMNEDSTTGNAFAALPYFTSEASSLSATALPHGLVSSALRPKPHSPLVSTSGLVGNTSTVAPRKELGSLSTLTQSSPAQPPRTQQLPPPPQQQQEERRVLVQEDTNSNSNNDNNKSSLGKREAVREAVAGDVDTAMISGRRSPWYSSSVNSSNASAAGALEGGQRLQHAQAADTNDATAGDGMCEAAPMSLASYGQRLAVLRDALHARRQALLACQRELQEVREEWRRDMHACRARHDRLQAQELRKTKAALEDYARALNEAVLRVKAASHEWRAQQARYRATLAALTTQTQAQPEKEEEDEEGEGRVRHGAARQRSGGASQALSSAVGPGSTVSTSGGASSFMVDQLQQLVRRAAELERMLPNARHAA